MDALYCLPRQLENHPSNLIPSLCKQFYDLGWVTGTGGGISIKNGNEIYIAPSGVQKERILPEDLFVQDIDGNDIKLPPSSKCLKKSQCTPLFMCAYKGSGHYFEQLGKNKTKTSICLASKSALHIIGSLYIKYWGSSNTWAIIIEEGGLTLSFVARNAGAVIHTHSKAAVMATLMYPGNEFKCTHLEMIKGIKNAKLGRNYMYNEELVVPIIENTPWEEDLKERMAEVMEQYPETCAILVRRHGVYVWGDTWQRAKTMCECYDYLFDITVQMRKAGIDPTVQPGVTNI